MLLYLELAMFVFGVYLLIAGKLKFGTTNIEGAKARMIGLFLAGPLVLAFLIGFVLGFLIGLGILPASAGGAAISIIEILLVLGGLVLAFLNIRSSTPPQA